MDGLPYQANEAFFSCWIEGRLDARRSVSFWEEGVREIALSIGVNEQKSPLTLLANSCGQPRGVSLSDAAFQIQEGDDVSVVAGLRVHAANYTIVPGMKVYEGIRTEQD